MKTCRKCGGPVLNATGVCGVCRVPKSALAHMNIAEVGDNSLIARAVDAGLGGEKVGQNGTYETQTSDLTAVIGDVGPVLRSGMALYAMRHLDAAAVMAAEIAELRFSKPKEHSNNPANPAEIEPIPSVRGKFGDFMTYRDDLELSAASMVALRCDLPVFPVPVGLSLKAYDYHTINAPRGSFDDREVRDAKGGIRPGVDTGFRFVRTAA